MDQIHQSLSNSLSRIGDDDGNYYLPFDVYDGQCVTLYDIDVMNDDDYCRFFDVESVEQEIPYWQDKIDDHHDDQQQVRYLIDHARMLCYDAYYLTKNRDACINRVIDNITRAAEIERRWVYGVDTPLQSAAEVVNMI